MRTIRLGLDFKTAKAYENYFIVDDDNKVVKFVLGRNWLSYKEVEELCNVIRGTDNRDKTTKS